MRKLWWFLIAALLVSASTGAFLLSKGQKVNAARTVKADMIQYMEASGKVQSKEEHILYAEAGGNLQEVYVQVGDRVSEQQVLAVIDPADTKLKLEQLEMQLKQVEADWNKLQEGPRPEEIKLQEELVHQAEIKWEAATRQWKRYAGTVTKEELQQKEDEMKLAESNWQAARHQLSLMLQGPSEFDTKKYNAKIEELQLQKQQLENDLSHMQILSNWSGTVTDLSIQKGQLVNRGMKLLTVSDLSQIEIVSDVKETLISQVFMNQEAVIEGDALGREQYKARVIEMEPIARPSQEGLDKKSTVTVTLELEKPSDKLLPGYHVDINFISNRALSALQVPRSAVKRNDDGSHYVWLVQGTRAVRKPVEIGMSSEAFIEIKSGLEEGSFVIMDAPEALKEGQKVAFSQQ